MAVWLYDFERGILRRQTFEGSPSWVLWGPGPEEFTYNADPDGPQGLYVKALDSGTGSGERLATGSEAAPVPSSRSPDGRRLAYTSDESGREEVYVRPFPGPGRPVQVSTSGGIEPRWSRDGREIFYTLWDLASWTPEYYAAPVEGDGDDLRPGVPRRLFAGRYGGSYPVRGYDVGPDFAFLLIKQDPDWRTRIRAALAPARIDLVLNWFEELRTRAPVD